MYEDSVCSFSASLKLGQNKIALKNTQVEWMMQQKPLYLITHFGRINILP